MTVGNGGVASVGDRESFSLGACGWRDGGEGRMGYACLCSAMTEPRARMHRQTGADMFLLLLIAFALFQPLFFPAFVYVIVLGD